METAVITALVAGIASIASALVAVVVKDVLERRSLKPIFGERRKALTGYWKGTIEQPNLTADLTVHLVASHKEVNGIADLRFPFHGKDHHLVLSLKGGFLYERFLKLDYKKDNEGVIQFGSLIIEFAEDSETLKGKYSGYGSLTKSIVSGEILLSRSR